MDGRGTGRGSTGQARPEGIGGGSLSWTGRFSLPAKTPCMNFVERAIY